MGLNESLNSNAPMTFKDKLTKWKKNKSEQMNVPLEMLERKRDDANGDEDDDGDVKVTLMSHGFIERINLSPIQVISEMPLTKIYIMFHILKPQNVYVTKYSRLIGVINEMHLLNREFETQRATKKTRICCLKCRRKCRQMCCCSCF